MCFRDKSCVVKKNKTIIALGIALPGLKKDMGTP